MFWVLLILGGMAAFVAIAAITLQVLGGRLPETHEASASALFPTSPTALFAYATDPARLTAWRADLRTVEALPPLDGKPAWREIGKYGTLTLCAEELRPPTPGTDGRYVTRITNEDAPFGGQWTWIFAAEGDGCRLTLTENGRIKGRAVRAIAHHFMGVDATVHMVLKALMEHAPR